MGAHHAGFIGNVELVQGYGDGLDFGPVAIAAQDDANLRRSGVSHGICSCRDRDFGRIEAGSQELEVRSF
jgi:hypothetical protein